jgi:D-beta-D-heptose 7-phosphate kinase/D-beta-D-heptose 1-phosphate adenosyltransferase
MSLHLPPIVVVSGGFDPVHSGHIAMFRDAAQLGLVVVALNSDTWLTRKKGRPFMQWDERSSVISAMKWVHLVVPMNDDDGSACDGIRYAQEVFPKHKIIFANGGDRKGDNTPEVVYCQDNNVELVWNIGGGKTQSSSWFLRDWNS